MATIEYIQKSIDQIENHIIDLQNDLKKSKNMLIYLKVLYDITDKTDDDKNIQMDIENDDLVESKQCVEIEIAPKKTKGKKKLPIL